jgi:hypothetical protein
MEEHRDEYKPLWFSEVGCPGMGDPRTSADWWLGPNVREADQAQWIRTLYGEPLQWKGLEKIFWSYFRDVPEHWGDGTDYFGLVRNNLSKKPAFEAYRQAARRFQTPQPVRA